MCNNEENMTFISNHVNGTRYLILLYLFSVFYLKFSNTSNNGSETPRWTELVSRWEKKRCRHLTCWGCPCVSALSFTFSPWPSASLFPETPFFWLFNETERQKLPENDQVTVNVPFSSWFICHPPFQKNSKPTKNPHSSTRHKPWKTAVICHWFCSTIWESFLGEVVPLSFPGFSISCV